MKFWLKINRTHLGAGGSGVRMLQFGPYFSQTEIDGVAGWIDQTVPAGAGVAHPGKKPRCISAQKSGEA